MPISTRSAGANRPASDPCWSYRPTDSMKVSKAKGIPWHVALAAGGGTGLRTASFAMVEAIRCVSRERLAKRLGEVPDATMGEVERRLRILLEL
jgi:mRNA-degrading endonuclease toxin of MazEF toxin-antitoxin module